MERRGKAKPGLRGTALSLILAAFSNQYASANSGTLGIISSPAIPGGFFLNAALIFDKENLLLNPRPPSDDLEVGVSGYPSA